MTASILRDKWIKFFEAKGHVDLSNMSLIPPSSDKSLLFINSGVAAIKSYFYGDAPPSYKRIVSCQKVIRTGDIDAIGESFRHHTYFEMLGNFSIRDYFKTEAISWAWEFLTKELFLDPEKLYVTIYEEDKEAFNEWIKLIDPSRIILGNRDTNFWDMGVGPCGPCTEIYYDKGEKYDPDNKELSLLINNEENERYLEIWNIVFSEYLNIDGNIIAAPQKNIDTGAGLERLLSVLENKGSNFETSLFTPITGYIESNFSDLKKHNLWAISDYFRTSCLLLNEGIRFGNKGREYVLRKIFRKSLQLLSIKFLEKDFFSGLVEIVSESLPYYEWNKEKIVKSMNKEISLYLEVNEIAFRFLEDLMNKYPKEVPEQEIFNLVTRHGLDFWNIEKILKDNGKTFSKEKYEDLLERHKDVSQNHNISSAFLKKYPSLLELKVSSEIDYESESIQGNIVALFDQEFNSREEINDGYIVLDKTVIFPCSGGQESDDGTINGEKVISSFKAPNGQAIHEVKGNYKLNQSVLVFRDSKKRSGLEIHHTLEHLFYELLKREVSSDIERSSGNKYFNCFILEILVPEDISREDFNLKELNNKLFNLINQNLEVKTSYITLEESKSMGLPQHFEEVYKKSSNKLRLVDIGGYSKELCIGTHVSNTKEIKDCLITEIKKKQSNVHRFKVLAGDYVRDFLLEKNIKKENYYDHNDEELIKQKKALKRSQFNFSKSQLIEEFLSSTEELIFLYREIETPLVLATFKELHSKLRNQTVFLYFLEEKLNAYRFFVVSDVLDINVVLEKYRNEYGWKCGGNKGFGSGMGSGEDFKERAIRYLK